MIEFYLFSSDEVFHEVLTAMAVAVHKLNAFKTSRSNESISEKLKGDVISCPSVFMDFLSK